MMAATMAERDRLNFKTVDQALRWAYRVLSAQPLPVSSIYHAKDPPRERRPMTGGEQRAQAAAIVDLTERALEPRLLEYVRARYKADFSSIDGLRGWVAAGLPTGVHRQKAIEKLLLIYLGYKISVHALRADLRCRTETAMSYRDITNERLNALHHQMENALQASFDERGWLR